MLFRSQLPRAAHAHRGAGRRPPPRAQRRATRADARALLHAGRRTPLLRAQPDSAGAPIAPSTISIRSTSSKFT